MFIKILLWLTTYQKFDSLFIMYCLNNKNFTIPKLKIIKILLYQILICGYKYYISIYIWLVIKKIKCYR